jgi:hypothetical protein
MLLLDFLLLVMIGICIIYCYILNRRIYDLYNSRVEFAGMIKELNSSILKAESNVRELTNLGKITINEISVAISEAKNTVKELAINKELGETLIDALNSKIKAAESELKNGYFAEREKAPEEYNVRKNIGEKFTDEDLAAPEEESAPNYTNQLKNFIHHIVGGKRTEAAVNLDRNSYYETLRRISVKK